jgi:hypothetical protein
LKRLVLRPNVGAEESADPQVAAARAVGHLWRLLFPADSAWPEPEAEAWPDILASPDDAAFAWLPESGLCAWWNDAASAASARRDGLALYGADPAVVARVHDKAFSMRVCDAERIGPGWLRERLRAFDPGDLSDVARFREALRRELAAWPDELARTATLKPRLGTSGRGRVRAHDPDAPELAGALPRLAARGGALLEPWLERIADYSVQLHVARDGTLTLLGTLALCVSPSGVYRGHRGELDHRGRGVSGADLDDRLIEAASEIARAAHTEGYFGPCGVDSFVFRHRGEDVLRPVVELNARFTTGTVLLGILRRARSWIGATIPAEPGERRSFAFGFGETAPAKLAGEAVRVQLGENGATLAVSRGKLSSTGN